MSTKKKPSRARRVPRTTKIQIATHSGRELTVDAFPYGPFAVHRHISTAEIMAMHPSSTWTVTHVPTGLAAAMFCATKASAFTLARMLVATKANWNVKKLSKRTNALGKACVERFRKLNL